MRTVGGDRAKRVEIDKEGFVCVSARSSTQFEMEAEICQSLFPDAKKCL